MALGISEEHVIEHHEGDEYWPDELAEDAVVFTRNDTDPSVITDGVDVVSVVQEEDDYRVTYWGYMVGEMRVASEGVQELGELLLSDSDVPGWLLDVDTIDEDEPPWWIPDDVEIRPTVECQQCGETVYAGNILTPEEFDDGGYRFCQTCWEEIDPEYFESMADTGRFEG